MKRSQPVPWTVGGGKSPPRKRTTARSTAATKRMSTRPEGKGKANLPLSIDCGASRVAVGFGKLLESGAGSDIKLICSHSSGERTFTLHRQVLIAQCPYFSAMLLPRDDDFFSEEATNGVINVDDVPADVMQGLVEHIYTGKCSMIDDDSKLADLFYGAHKWQLDELQAKCESLLAERLSIDNVTSVALLADRHRAEGLRKAALDFMKRNAKELTRDANVEKALSANPKLMFEVFRAVAGN